MSGIGSAAAAAWHLGECSPPGTARHRSARPGTPDSRSAFASALRLDHDLVTGSSPRLGRAHVDPGSGSPAAAGPAAGRSGARGFSKDRSLTYCVSSATRGASCAGGLGLCPRHWRRWVLGHGGVLPKAVGQRPRHGRGGSFSVLCSSAPVRPRMNPQWLTTPTASRSGWARLIAAQKAAQRWARLGQLSMVAPHQSLPSPVKSSSGPIRMQAPSGWTALVAGEGAALAHQGIDLTGMSRAAARIEGSLQCAPVGTGEISRR